MVGPSASQRWFPGSGEYVGGGRLTAAPPSWLHRGVEPKIRHLSLNWQWQFIGE
jgi:hypothetical protein